jgi:hypothetical protein
MKSDGTFFAVLAGRILSETELESQFKVYKF